MGVYISTKCFKRIKRTRDCNLKSERLWLGFIRLMEIRQPCFAGLLPDSTGAKQPITFQNSSGRPALTFANQPIGGAPGRSPLIRGQATQVTREKIERERKKTRKKNSGACYGVRVKETQISTLLYQLNQYLWIGHTKVQQQVESLTANSSVAPLKIISPPFFSLPLCVHLNWVSSPFVPLSLSLGKKGDPSWYFYLNLCFNCSFYPCGPWWLRTVILWWCSLGQQLVQMGVNWVRMRGK